MAKENDVSAEVRHWLSEISSAKKRESDFLKDGEKIIDIYSGNKADEIPFNILFSNVETLLPALFSQTPRPVVQRRFKDDDPIGKAAAMAAQRMLEFLCDTNVDGYETFDQSMRYATLDALLPGRGVSVVKYDAEILEGDGIETPVVKWEQVCTESKKWDRVYFGFARKWSKVPWIAYEEYLDEEEASRLFGKEVASKINYTTGEDEEDDDSRGTGTGGRDSSESEYGERKTALVYQIWDKSGGKVIRYVSPQYTDGFLLVQDDPLKLTGFFNCPRPIQFIEKSSDLTPTAMYKLYENQAKELNNITRRIQRVVSAIKVRGVFDGNLGSQLETLLSEDDNALIPAESASSLATERGFDNAIWFLPLERLIAVLQQLIIAREQAKRVIYEITGVSDIVRGQSVASETLGAQKIKEAWGTMRLKRMQKSVQVYCRDTLRIMLEIAASKMSEDTWARATGLPFATEQVKAQSEMMVKAAMANGVQPDPKAVQLLQSPAWPDVLKILQDDLQRAYRIDIETNSTIDVEATEDQKNISDFMNALGQMLAGLTPMVDKGAMPFDAAKSIMLEVVRRYRFGNDVEDQIKTMKAPEPKQDPKAAAAVQEAQQKQAEMQQEVQRQQTEFKMKQQEMQAEMQMRIQEFKAEMQLEAAKLQAEKQMEISKLQAEIQKNEMNFAMQGKIERMKGDIQRDIEIKKAAMAGAAQIEIARINAQAKVVSEQQNEGSEIDAAERAAQSDGMMAAMIETQQRLLEILSAPKKIERDAAGRAVKLIPQNGQPI